MNIPKPYIDSHEQVKSNVDWRYWFVSATEWYVVLLVVYILLNIIHL